MGLTTLGLALAISYFADGAKVNSEARAGICDDMSTWTKWVSDCVCGGRVANSEVHTPLVYVDASTYS